MAGYLVVNWDWMTVDPMEYSMVVLLAVSMVATKVALMARSLAGSLVVN